MTPTRRLLLGIALLALPATVGFAKDLPTYDASEKEGGAAPFSLRAGERALIRTGTDLHTDDRFGVPSFLWAARRGEPAAAPARAARISGEQAEGAARHHLDEYASLYRLEAADLSAATVRSVHNTGRGAIIVSFRQKVDGIEVFRDEMKVVMDQKLGLIALSGHLPGVSSATAAGGARAFALDAAMAIAAALEDYLGAGLQVDPAEARRVGTEPEGHERYDLSAGLSEALGLRTLEPIRVKRVYFRLPDRLEPAYHVEMAVGPADGTELDYYAYVISAVEGRLLFRRNLTASDSYAYRVWAETSSPFVPFDGPQGSGGTPHPTGVPDGTQPPFTSPGLVTLQNGPISTNDPWLPPGSTQTVGNNVDAYADLATPDGLGPGDFRASTTGPGTFDRTYNTSAAPASSQSQQMASITQIFYTVNFLHDWFYDAGFDEDSGNAQASNYGRGGLQNDSLKAEAQDFSGRNNANMSTPSDGFRPRMQMFVWDGIGRRALTVNSPFSIDGDYAVGTAQFGPPSFNTTANAVLVDDGAGTTSDACETPFVNAGAVAGKIAFIDRGTCNFTVKVKNAQLNGAVGAIVANNQASGILNMGGADATITIPSLFISQADGDTIRAQLGAGVNATLLREAAVDRDGTIDNQIVAHEWGHYISNRLIGDSAGLTNSQGNGMGEGWSDFHALLMTVRQEDSLVPGNESFQGTYAVATYVSGGGPNGPLPNTGFYFGIRRYPYSTDMSKNPLTFEHIADGVPLPAGPPAQFGADGFDNAEVHNAGEVWGTMLWECYAALLRDTLGGSPRLTFAQARSRMIDYLVAAYKMTPGAPTFLEARDAMLAAAQAGDPRDYELFWQAFARRGIGFRAAGPHRSSTAHQGVVESFFPGVDLVFRSAALDDVVYCDNDGVLDDTEIGSLTITLEDAGGSGFSATTGTVSSTNPAVSFPGGGQISFPETAPFGLTTAPVEVELNGASGLLQIDFEIAFTDPSFRIPGTATARFSARGQADDVAGQSAFDDVESASPRWTPVGGALPWRREEVSPLDHRWHGPDHFLASDLSLVSPVLNVAPTGAFAFTFRHRYFFEFLSSPLTRFDGGVIEISANGGATWTDIGAFASPGYTGALATGGGNPLGGRNAYAQVSPGWPDFTTATVNLGGTYLGQSVMIRFRIGTDSGGDDPGWDIDDIAFSNVTNLPFNSVVPDRGICLDSDADGFLDRSDCAPLDPAAWAPPSEALDLEVAGAGTTMLRWSAPASPGGTSVVYDLLRSPAASSFSAAACVESDESDLAAVDPAVPGGIFYYLVRSQNVCGGSLGADSSGNPRSGSNCP